MTTLTEVTAFSFRGLGHYHHGREHGGGVQADMVLATSQSKGNRKWTETFTGCGLRIYKTSTSTPTVIHFFQKGYTYSNKATSPNSTTPCEIMEANYIQTTTACLKKTNQPNKQQQNRCLNVFRGFLSEILCLDMEYEWSDSFLNSSCNPAAG